MTSRDPTTTEPTGQASPFDRQNVTVSAGSARSVGRTPSATTAFQNRAPSMWSGTPCARAIAATLPGVLGRQRLAHRVGVGVLEGDQAGDRLVQVGRVAEGGLDLGRVDRAVRPVLERPDARADDDRVTGRLVEDHVVLAARDGLLAAREVGHLGDEVAHRPGRDEEAGFLAEQLGGALLEGVDRRVVAEDVVAELGLGHRPAHRRGGVGDGVAAQVDPWHGRASIGLVRRRGRPMATTQGASAMLRPRRNWTRGVAAQHASLSRWRSPVRIRSGPPSLAFPYAPSARPDGAFLCPGGGPDGPSAEPLSHSGR